MDEKEERELLKDVILWGIFSKAFEFYGELEAALDGCSIDGLRRIAGGYRTQPLRKRCSR